MKPRIHVLTLAVDDLERSHAFYRALGLPSSGIVGYEHVGDAENAAGAIALFQLDGGFFLCLYPRTELAKDAKVALSSTGSGEFSIGHPVATREEVDDILSAAQEAGATVTDPPHERPWGI
ncbi:MAG TPA: VOC family protein [Chloroflexota bacterium]|nr:VOC family protein [Chloroflexota bacterium]